MKAKNAYWFCVRLLLVLLGIFLVAKLRAAEPEIPIVHIVAVDPCAEEEGADTATFTVVRDGPTNAALSVLYSVGGSAANGVDYALLNGVVTIPAGAHRAPIVITPVDDSLVEGSEIVLLVLNQPLVWPPPYIVCWPSLAFGHIVDNDTAPTNRPPHVRMVNPPDGSVLEAGDIRLAAAAGDADGRVVSVEFFAGTNSLGIVSNRPPRLSAESLEVAASEAGFERDPELFPDFDPNGPVIIGPVPEALFRLVWSNAPPGQHTLTALATDNDGASTRSPAISITIIEPPQQAVVTVKATDPVASEGDLTRPVDVLDTATFTVHRTGGTDLPLTVYYRLSGTASNGVDYRELPHSVTIPRGERAAEVIIVPVDDELVEGSEKIALTIVPPICPAIFPPPPECYLVGRPHVGEAVLHDNDIRPTNRPPVVEIVRPLDGSVFIAPVNVAIVTQARDFDGRVVSVEFFAGHESLGVVSNTPAALTANRPPFFLVWSNAPIGRHVLTALATDNDGAQSRSRPVDIKIVERTVPPVVTVSAPDAEAAETLPNAPANTATFSLARTGGTARPLLVHYSLSGSASNGVDYRLLSGRVTIPVGAASANVVVEPIDDTRIEGLESVVLTIEPAVCIAIDPTPPDCYRVGNDYIARAVIRDNDVAPSNQPPKIAIVRPEDGDVFVALADISIYAETRDPDGFVRTVEFFANGTSLGVVSNSLNSGAISNTFPEHLFRFAWSNVAAGAYALTARATDSRGAMSLSELVRIRVVDPSPPVVVIEATDPYASEGPNVFPLEPASANLPNIEPFIDVAVFTVKRSGGTNVDLVVGYSLGGTASNGVDYQLLNGKVTIPRGAWSARIIVRPINDLIHEGTETVHASLDPVACPRVVPPPECYLVGDPGRATAYIRDNDPPANVPPRVEIGRPTDGQVFAAPADIEIVVYARDPDGWVSRVDFFADDRLIGSEEIHFIQAPPPGELQKFSLTWSNVPPGRYVLTAKATDDDGAMTRSDEVKIVVVEPCRIPVVSVEAVDEVASEPNPLSLSPVLDTATLRVKRSCGTNSDLVVYYALGGSARNGVDYRELSGRLLIPRGAWFADIVVEAIDDALVEGTETVKLCIEAPVCIATDPPSPGCYLVGRPDCAGAYIRDNDLPPNDPPRVTLVSPPDGAVFEAPADIRLAARAHDGDGYIKQVEFFAGTTSLGVVVNHPSRLDPSLTPAAVDALSPEIIPIDLFVLIWSNAPPGVYQLTAVATDDDGATTRSEPVEIKVVEPPVQTVVSVLARDPKAAERDTDPAIFAVKRRGPTNLPLVVYYRLGGTASNGVDYRELPHTVTIAAGERAAAVIVEPIDDALVEGTETVVITIVPPPCLDIFPQPPDCYLVGRQRSARAAIYDNDSPPNEPPVVRLVEPQDGETFLAPADIRLAAHAFDSDGRVTQVEFFEGMNSLGVVAAPQLSEALHPLFTLVWSNVPPGHYVLTAVATDDDGDKAESEPVEIKVAARQLPPVVNLITTDAEGAEINPLTDQPENPAIFTVTRTGSTADSLLVHYRVGGSALNGVDYTFLRGHVTIPMSAASTDIVVAVLDDLLCEGDEKVVVELVPALCVAEFPPPHDCNYVVGTNRTGRAVIHDNDVCPPNQPPKVAIIHPGDGDVFPAGETIRFCAEAKDADGRVVSVEFFANNLSLGVVAMPPGEEVICLAWVNPRPGGYVLTAKATDNLGAKSVSDPVRIKVVERPVRTVVSIEATVPVGFEGAPDPVSAIFTVKRSAGTNAPLTVFYSLSGSASNNVDYAFLRGHVTIPAGAWSARIEVAPIDDNLVEGTENVIAALQPPVCIAIYPPPPECYLVGVPGRAEAFIRDNDSTPNLPPHVAILIPDEGATFTAPAEIEILAVALDSDGWVTQIVFFEGTNQIGGLAILVSEPPPPGQLQTFRFTWNDAPPGNHALTAKVWDNRGAMTVSAPVHIRVIDPCRVPVVTISAVDPWASEPFPILPAIDTATLVVRRSCQFHEPLLVYYEIGGTAANGTDYRRFHGEVLIPAGEESARIVVEPFDDNLVEGTETVVIELNPRLCNVSEVPPPGCYHVGVPGRAVAHIRDNDAQANLPPRVAITSPHAGQQFEAPANIPVMAQALDPDGWVPRVDFYANDEHIGFQEIVFIQAPPPGQLQVFTIRWTNVRAGRYELTAKATDNNGAMTVSPPVVIEVIETPQIPVVNIVAIDPFAREGTANTAIFRVRRTGPTNAPLTVFYQIRGSALNGADYETIPASLTIPAGRRAARVVITPIDDRIVEGIETVVLRLLPAALYNVGRPGAAGAIIVDNDHPRPASLRLADGLVHFCTPANTGFCYRLEASANLVDWEPLLSNVVTDDALQYVDPDASDNPARFYRVVPEVLEMTEDE